MAVCTQSMATSLTPCEGRLRGQFCHLPHPSLPFTEPCFTHGQDHSTERQSVCTRCPILPRTRGVGRASHYSHAKRWLEKGTPSVLCRPHPSPNSADAPECSVPTIYTHGGRWKAPRGSGLSHVPHYDVPKGLWLDGYQTHAPLLINESVLSLPFKQHSLSLHPHQSEPQKGEGVRDRC